VSCKKKKPAFPAGFFTAPDVAGLNKVQSFELIAQQAVFTAGLSNAKIRTTPKSTPKLASQPPTLLRYCQLTNTKLARYPFDASLRDQGRYLAGL
jgi:hypothetical protein